MPSNNPETAKSFAKLPHYLVVGAGLNGASLAWHLTAAGHRVTLIERTAPAAVGSSSHGSARIFRASYADEKYARLTMESLSWWRKLEDVSGQKLLNFTGHIEHGDAAELGALAAVLARAGVPYELIEVAEASERWPQYLLEGEYVLWQPQGGVLDAAATVHALIAAAQATGLLELYLDTEIERITQTATQAVAYTASGAVFKADHAVVAAGSWLPRELLARIDFTLPTPQFTVREVLALHFPYREGYSDFPTIIHRRGNVPAYALPGGADVDGTALKFAFHGGRPRQEALDYVAKYIPGVVPEAFGETLCNYTQTPDEEFFIETDRNITLFSACSGHAAKFAPLLGRLLVERGLLGR
ncbi:FAD-dependent oxidoreductase [Canibacter zhoujuaniae]|uniref:FAD-dependent oxidoreductase n=1 Tax=Canibacter zhoujuaniae TaxID=2708343 RepID=UPI0014240C4F|nr:FAD-dependent oxidoreductase [Canibacter zhoujuaniae]